ncbi:MAG: SOS response-associated peptidase [Deltaproteobacteria bacterium]|nr:SOS response-associated peptidase [Deltaproteobacteria bacterium]
MCGRYVVKHSKGDMQRVFPQFQFPEVEERLDVRPTTQVLVATAAPGSIELMRWGLLPPWAPDVKAKIAPINAMSETIQQKRMFKKLFEKRRCVFFASGFYEWRAVAGQKKKQRNLITVGEGEPIAFAGLWDIWHPKEEALKSCTILTTGANELVSTIHNRMPVILDAKGVEAWLDPNASLDALQAMTVARSPDGMKVRPVEEPPPPPKREQEAEEAEDAPESDEEADA